MLKRSSQFSACSSWLIASKWILQNCINSLIHFNDSLGVFVIVTVITVVVVVVVVVVLVDSGQSFSVTSSEHASGDKFTTPAPTNSTKLIWSYRVSDSLQLFIDIVYLWKRHCWRFSVKTVVIFITRYHSKLIKFPSLSLPSFPLHTWHFSTILAI